MDIRINLALNTIQNVVKHVIDKWPCPSQRRGYTTQGFERTANWLEAENTEFLGELGNLYM